MKRENRYLVIKRADIREYLDENQRRQLEEIDFAIAAGREQDNKPNTEYVVVGSDWPMYEQTWKAIEQWVDSGTLSAPQVVGGDMLSGPQPSVHDDKSGDYFIIEYPNGRTAYAQRKAPPSASHDQLTPIEETLVLLCEHWNTRTSPGAGGVVEALKVAETAFTEVMSARSKGADWFTKGFEGQQQHIQYWLRKGFDAVKAAQPSAAEEGEG